MRPATTPAPEPIRSATPSSRPGGRSERVVRDVLSAALATLAETGYAALSIETVAIRAGVNKTTVYRRWPTKVDLVGAALRFVGADARGTPDTGSLRGDLLALVRRSVERMATLEGRGVVRMLTIEMDDPEVGALARDVRKEFQTPWREVIERAIGRGDLPKGSDADLVVDTILGFVGGRVRKRMPLDDSHLVAVLELVLVGAERGGAVLKAPAAAAATAKKPAAATPKGSPGRVGGVRRGR